MERIPVYVFNSDKILDGQKCFITSINDDYSFWIIWDRWDGTKSRAKLHTGGKVKIYDMDMEPVSCFELIHWRDQGL